MEKITQDATPINDQELSYQWMLDIDTSTWSPSAKKLWNERINNERKEAEKQPLTELDVLRLLVDAHGSKFYLEVKEITLQQHLDFCENQYTERKKKSIERYIGIQLTSTK